MQTSGAGRPARAGFALVAVVLILIGLAALATGLLFASSQQAILVASTHDVLRARLAAEAALTPALRDWVAARRALDPVGVSEPLLPHAVLERRVLMSAVSERLGPELFLLTGRGSASRVGAPAIEQSVLHLVRSLDADAIGRALDAAGVASHASLASPAVVQGAGADAAPLDDDAARLCARWPRDGAALRAPADSVVAAAGAVLSGSPPITPDPDPARFLAGLGFLDAAALADEAVRIDEAIVTPEPVLAGDACATEAPGNWGAPAGPCALHWPLRHAPGALTVDGGYGQGVLIVDGDLVLDGGARLRGIVIARGTLTLRSASIEGVLLAGRLVMEGGSADLDRCAVASALSLAGPLRRPHRPARSRLPAFD